MDHQPTSEGPERPVTDTSLQCRPSQLAEPSHYLSAPLLLETSLASKVKEQLWGCHPKDEQAGNSDPLQTFSKALQATDKRAQQQGPRGGSACRFVRLLKQPGEGHPGRVAANISPPKSHINTSKVLQAEVRSAAKGSGKEPRPGEVSTEQAPVPIFPRFDFSEGNGLFFSVFKEKPSPAVNAAQIS